MISGIGAFYAAVIYEAVLVPGDIGNVIYEVVSTESAFRFTSRRV
jgi:hypothetical protein